MRRLIFLLIDWLVPPCDCSAPAGGHKFILRSVFGGRPACDGWTRTSSLCCSLLSTCSRLMLQTKVEALWWREKGLIWYCSRPGPVQARLTLTWFVRNLDTSCMVAFVCVCLYPSVHSGSQPRCSQWNFSCALRVWGRPVTERGLWALLHRSSTDCQHLVPGLWLLAALKRWDVCVFVDVGVCTGGSHPSGKNSCFFFFNQQLLLILTYSPAKHELFWMRWWKKLSQFDLALSMFCGLYI